MPARGLYARKNPPSHTNTTLADGKAARTRSPLRCFCHAHHSDHYRQHDFKGDILTLIKEAENYILKNIGIGMKLDGLVRVDVPEIDRKAFREAIINAFCHRDYRDPNDVRSAIFPDHVEVRNPGRLMDGIAAKAQNLQSLTPPQSASSQPGAVISH
jgi:predicted HTH transcriptional regulator